jgi:hypothetical protein
MSAAVDHEQKIAALKEAAAAERDPLARLHTQLLCQVERQELLQQSKRRELDELRARERAIMDRLAHMVRVEERGIVTDAPV